MFVSTGIAADIIGVCTKTLYNWERNGRFLPAFRTAGGHRRYDVKQLKNMTENGGNIGRTDGKDDEIVPEMSRTRAVCYSRVSAPKQRGDIERQETYLKEYCSEKGYNVVMSCKDIASGLNDNRKGLMRLMDAVMSGRVDRVVVTYGDRMARFGTGIIKRVLKNNGVELEMAMERDKKETEKDSDGHRELMDDLVAIITSFAGKLHRKRRGKTSLPVHIDKSINT